MTVTYLLWSIPLMVIAVSYLFSRFIPFRKVRYCCYAMILTGAFLLNLFHLSFHNDVFDTILMMSINFIIGEFIWNILRLKRKRLFFFLLGAALIIYGLEFRQWFVAGPERAKDLWKSTIASTYCCRGIHYTIKERNLFDRLHPAKLLILSKQLGNFPFEREINSYRTPEGFRYTDFAYKWSASDQGVRVELIAAGYRLWTLGDGL